MPDIMEISTMTFGGKDMLMTDSIEQYLIFMAPIAFAILFVAAAVGLVVLIVRTVLRHLFESEFGVSLASSIWVHKTSKSTQVGSFQLDYPYWRSAKRDGTRDRRTNDQAVIKPKSILHINGWKATSKNPLDLYDLVIDLRATGQTIGCCKEERAKRSLLANEMASRMNATSIMSVVNMFRDNPTGFEPFCADLFRRYGYRAEVTPPSRDGGYDLKLWKDGVSYIVECKCYAPNHHIGRPIVQKLEGANRIAQANGMMVITTSGFSQDAMDYAAQTGILLIDGNRLLSMIQQVYGTGERRQPISESQVALTRHELLARIPADLRDRY